MVNQVGYKVLSQSEMLLETCEGESLLISPT